MKMKLDWYGGLEPALVLHPLSYSNSNMLQLFTYPATTIHSQDKISQPTCSPQDHEKKIYSYTTDSENNPFSINPTYLKPKINITHFHGAPKMSLQRQIELEFQQITKKIAFYSDLKSYFANKTTLQNNGVTTGPANPTRGALKGDGILNIWPKN